MSALEEELLGLIHKTEGHLTAEEIFLLCKKEGVKTSVASVYRVLGNLERSGKLRKLRVPGETDRYDKHVYDHEHLLCERCGEVMDLNIPQLKEYLEQKAGVEVLAFDLNIRYICPRCAARQGDGADGGDGR